MSIWSPSTRTICKTFSVFWFCLQSRMGAFTSQIIVPEAKACTKHTDPKKPNWITIHAVATELSIAEVERLWLRFKQLGCSEKGELSDEALAQHSTYQDAFSRNIMKKFINPRTKTISFENFLRGLKWCETSNTEDKLRGIFRMLNNGNNLPKDIFRKIIERVYIQPDDKGQNIDRVVNTLYQFMDPENKGTINEENFVRGCLKLPQPALEEALNFELLPSHMRQELHSKLPEMTSGRQTQNHKMFSSTGPTPAPRSTLGGAIPDDKMLQRIAVKVYTKDWVRLANKLDFEFEDIEEFKSQNNDKRSQVYAMLKSWRNREGSAAQSTVLAQALRECRMDDAAALLA
uniref:Uncharacterized protein LOC111118094 isoform X3 n=1 Tax=Crassostrea virginica TaxID=6565 RepID=A0A8B8CBH0_CRAVI|nr:uncharacterized protein LOC111118094 isoform X3 [Crassostrea virginica]